MSTVVEVAVSETVVEVVEESTAVEVEIVSPVIEITGVEQAGPAGPRGPIIRSANGTRYRINVSDIGTLMAVAA